MQSASQAGPRLVQQKSSDCSRRLDNWLCGPVRWRSWRERNVNLGILSICLSICLSVQSVWSVQQFPTDDVLSRTPFTYDGRPGAPAPCVVLDSVCLNNAKGTGMLN
jgi:hypothetical protein